MKHHSMNEIFGIKIDALTAKHILACCTGSIAAFATPHLVRKIIRHSEEKDWKENERKRMSEKE